MTKLREMRTTAGQTITDICFELRLHQSNLSAVERGRMAASARVRQVLSELYGVNE